MSAPNLKVLEAAESAQTPHVIRELPLLVILPHSRCNCRCVMCDIWRIRQVREITAADLDPHMASLRELKVQWVVFSGGEPLMHSDLSALTRMLRREGIRTTILTAGLWLERQAAHVAEDFDDVIVSLDGPREIHDQVRGVPGAFDRLERGILALRQHRPSMQIHGRCTVQKGNFRYLRGVVGAAHKLGLNSISFLAADLSTEAFNHSQALHYERSANIAPSAGDLDGLKSALEELIDSCEEKSHYIRESREKLRRIASHFCASQGQIQHIAPRCNAPWVSAVIESDGSVRPCFFHPPFGNLRDGTFSEVLNSDPAIRFRGQLDVSRDAICRKCVCSLFLEKESAGLTR